MIGATVGLLGASGFTGRLVAATLEDRGVGFVAAGRDRRRIEDALTGSAQPLRIDRVEARAHDDIAAFAEGVEVVITTVGPYDDLGRTVAEAVAGRADYVDCTGEQAFIRWMSDHGERRFLEGGTRAVTAAGFDFLLGDLLAAMAGREVGSATEVHVAYTVRGPLGMLSRGTRTTIAAHLDSSATALEDGELRVEAFGDQRRLAWFPHPFGPRRVAGWPGGEPFTVPRHLRDVRTVRSYVDIPGFAVELGRFVTRAASLRGVERLARRLLERGPEGPSTDQRAETRWAVVAEATGSGGVVRGWATGADIYGFTAEALVCVAMRLAASRAGGPGPGLLAPAEMADGPEALLDELAERTGLRWSLAG